jgi:hypothetical protein
MVDALHFEALMQSVAFDGVLAVSTIGLWARGVRTQAADTRILQRAYLGVEPAGISESRTPMNATSIRLTRPAW